MGILLFLLASASDNSGLFDRYYPWLLGLNALAAFALLVLVAVSLWRLVARYRSGKFGSRLMLRLVLLFAGIGVLPGLVIFVVSIQFVSHSIDSWFNVRIEQALDSGLTLGRNALDEELTALRGTARKVAAQLADRDLDGTRAELERLKRSEKGLDDALLVNAYGNVLLSLKPHGAPEGQADLPNGDMIEHADAADGYAVLEGGVDSGARDTGPLDAAMGLRLRVLIVVPDHVEANHKRFLQLITPAPTNLAANAAVLTAAYSEYKERDLARVGLRKMYIETLTLTLLLAMFGAVVASFVIAEKLATPLLVLAEGTAAVAAGDFSPRPIIETTDELGTLTQSFNTMTRQLFEARAAVERNRAALQDAKAHLESVLENMSAGVLVLDAEFRVVSTNEAVGRILGTSDPVLVGKAVDEVDAGFAEAIRQAFSAQSAQKASGQGAQRTHWQQEIELPRQGGSQEDQGLALLARGSRLPVSSGSGYIVVFDDISDVIAAQRSIAWGEVARRLAHEIKNPLTPIQLSAERLQMKLEASLAATEAELLRKSTTTIINQVAAMKRMVDDFRDYARTPPAVLQPLDLNALIDDILQLYSEGLELGMIDTVLGPALPRVMGDPTQLRQVIHNLLQNAQDALSDRDPAAPPARITLSTEAVHYESAEGGAGTAVRLVISDNGPGFSPKILARAFEPYVTSKVRGTGLGLPMVKKIVDEHGGRIEIQNRTDGSGARIVILLLKLAQASPLADGQERA
ncbi:ATP-binding protein [Massilia sp. TS11]|uniref:sensor histidine kinase n=1 Tax=Massilia sp. TS11 TaxID=2908003 RepID=UPI001EDB3CEF|nr:ATP-binding protein [Massilia sp. TS11]MCG2585471.1 ATP-binding protein [Massilia sp. TS11]